MLTRTLLRAPRRAGLPANPNSLLSRPAVRYFAEQANNQHPTQPHTPPAPKSFFRKEKIGLEVTPLFALIGTIVVVATGAIVRNLIKDPDIHSRHGVEVDDKLKKVLEMDEPKGGEKKSEKK